jgi:hypothetical protein
MNTPDKRFLFWTPRILCILFAAFISMFALDVFNEHLGFWQTVLALLIHLIPTYLVLILLAVSWRWERIGGALLFALGIFYIVFSWGRFHWTVYAIIAGPLFLVGALFFLSWKFCKALPANVTPQPSDPNSTN